MQADFLMVAVLEAFVAHAKGKGLPQEKAWQKGRPLCLRLQSTTLPRNASFAIAIFSWSWLQAW